MTEEVMNYLAVVETVDPNCQLLNVVYRLAPVEVGGTDGQPRWVFTFTDCVGGKPISEIRKEETSTDGDYWLAVVLYEPSQVGQRYYPHRFVMRLNEAPELYPKTAFQQAAQTALQRVMMEMEMLLRQHYFRKADPAISYGRIITKSGKEVTLTHRTRFLSPAVS